MPATDRHLTLYYAPQTRATGARTLLEELQADHDLHLLDFRKGEQRQPAYLAVNPMGKVPALRHGEVLVTEQPAIYLYAAELYAERGLSPAVGDALRGPYLRWMVYYGSCFEPAMIDRSLKREPGSVGASPYGDSQAVIDLVLAQLERGPWWLGETFTAVDVLWGSALGWMTTFKMMPTTPALEAYLARYRARPAVQRVQKLEAELLVARGA